MSRRSERLVVKFGGSVLAGGAEIVEAARLVANCPADERLVVVSAPLGMTDRLLSLVEGAGERIAPRARAEVVASGERVSTRLFAAVLEELGERVRMIDTHDAAWPILTRGGPIDATIDEAASRRRAHTRLRPLLRRSIVVMPGFLGREGAATTTLRRGGSDTSALALGSFLEAEDTVLVKDVPGILSANPKLVEGARALSSVDAQELETLVRSGARVVAEEALRFIDGSRRVRVIPFGQPLLGRGGTAIAPSRPGPSDAARSSGPAAPTAGAVTMVMRHPEEALRALASELGERRWLGLSATPSAVTVYTDESEVVPWIRRLDRLRAFEAVASQTGLELSAASSAEPGNDGTRPVVGAYGSAGSLRWLVRRGRNRPAGARRRRKGGA